MSESKVFMFDNSDPEMRAAYEQARATFRYFWREVAWERRRIIPALGLACVKAPFSDGKAAKRDRDNPEVEHMWFGDVDFDGEGVSGTLLNSPNWLTSVKAGDPVGVPLGEISDWMYVIDDEVYGAYTVNLMRSRMDVKERQEHDAAWGLKFGDPNTIRLVPQKKGWFDTGDPATQEHPMSKAMAPSFKEQLAKNPSLARQRGEGGWTFLHQQALAGSTATVKVLLEAGADPNAKTDDGKTPLQLARALGWEEVAALLRKGGARPG